MTDTRLESILALPEHVRLERNAASRYADIDKEGTEARTKALRARVPKPVGFQVLIVKPKIEDMTEGGIVKPDAFLKRKKQEASSALFWNLARWPTKTRTNSPQARGEKRRTTYSSQHMQAPGSRLTALSSSW